jgi:hypothetical protein
MKLTSEFTSVRVAIPLNTNCPYDGTIEGEQRCAVLVRDWHIEWLPKEAQLGLLRGRTAMDCPKCRRGMCCVGDVKHLVRSQPGIKVFLRLLSSARQYEAGGQCGTRPDGSNKTLEEWIEQDNPAFKGYVWTEEQ